MVVVTIEDGLHHVTRCHPTCGYIDALFCYRTHVFTCISSDRRLYSGHNDRSMSGHLELTLQMFNSQQNTAMIAAVGRDLAIVARMKYALDAHKVARRVANAFKHCYLKVGHVENKEQ